MARHPAVAGQIALIASNTGRPAEAERWADMADRRQYQDASGAADPGAEAWPYRFTGSWAPAHAARRSPGPGSWASWMA